MSILDNPRYKFPKMEFLYPLSIAFPSAFPSLRPCPRQVLIQTRSLMDMTDLIINHQILNRMAAIASDIETAHRKIWNESEAHCNIFLYACRHSELLLHAWESF